MQCIYQFGSKCLYMSVFDIFVCAIALVVLIIEASKRNDNGVN